MKRLQARQPGAFQDLPAEVQELLAKMREHFPKADLDVLGEAYQFAAQAHHAQTRASGEPYINHSVTVAATLVDLRVDPVTIAAALLHDVAEDTDRKSTRLNSSHANISYAVFCLKKKNKHRHT